MGHTESAFYLWLSFIKLLRVYTWMRETEVKKDGERQNKSRIKEREWNKKCSCYLIMFISRAEAVPVLSWISWVFPLIIFFSFFFHVCLLRSPVSQFWHAMTVTVVYKSPFPWTVSACLLWDETTAIRSSAPQIPALSAWLCQTPHTQQSNITLVLHNHLVCFQAKYR